MRYQNTGKIKENGVVYTPGEMASYVAGEILRWRKEPFGQEIAILDPAAGSGELLIAMLRALAGQGKAIRAVGYETDGAVARRTELMLRERFPDADIQIRVGDFLEAVEQGSAGKYDCVIANPPYVRTQVMGRDRAQELADRLGLTGRVDVYYAFLVCTGAVLKPGGVAGYITSNKFMTIKAGNSVRNYMRKNYRLHHIVDLGDTKLFTASVLPCILVFSLGKTQEPVAFTSVYQAEGCGADIPSVFDAVDKEGLYQLPGGKCFRFRQGTLKSGQEDALWTIASREDQDWLRRVEEKTWRTFSQIGKIRVGIKTTADNVFIGEHWAEELELLRPLITHRNAGQILANPQAQWQVLYTHTRENGKKAAIDLEQFPKSRAYLLKHYAQLSSRTYLEKARRNWYEIWVPQDPGAWHHRKIVFRDISEQPQFWLDDTGAIVNGDCYWLDIHPDTAEDAVYLALAVANSPFIEKFYDIKFNNKLYSGKRRYQAQYVEQFPIPRWDSPLAQKAISLVKKIIAEGETAPGCKEQLDKMVEDLFS